MTRKTVTPFVILIAMLLPSPVAAEINGRTFRDYCAAAERMSRGERQDQRGEIRAVACLQYLQGFRLAWIIQQLMAEKHGVRPFHICFPKELEGQDISDQMIDIIVKYMSDNPTEGHMSIDVIVMRAFGEYYPCEG
ncbi:Rap1a/Tai family immunity protein [Sinorhizobium kummerowiae]|uniref:Rap1a/Tai family immunity protein n=1 Tax=Sinorhizobium kummerowiae TaxID=158892 RepID=A0ABY8TBP3_9HYPH|nr:Rap1a/Tai family immunity protein [Sinorhizobium kummerowiae]WHS95361.1 Rap1a/Tai family immunity protein [Sinorhizobium kummerowiae]WRW47328.1 Rap1a/Tai family immunity protein [Sinorhizobium kummerowiae]